jgi:TP901 family phage tail tape measure protein
MARDANIHIDSTSNVAGFNKIATAAVSAQRKIASGGKTGSPTAAMNAELGAFHKKDAAQKRIAKNNQQQYKDTQRSIDQSRRQAYALSVAGYQAQALGQAAMNAVKGWVSAFAEIDYNARRAASAFGMLGGTATDTSASIEMIVRTSNDLARSMGMADANTIAEGLYFYASTTGLAAKSQEELNQRLTEFVPIMQAASMTNTGLETAIKGVNGVINVFKMDVADTSEVVAKLFAASQASAAEFVDYLESFKQVGPVAAEMGATLDDVLIILSEFSDANVKGGKAGRALQQTLTKLASPTAGARKLLDELFRATVGVGASFDSLMIKNGSFVSYREYIDTLSKSLSQVTKAEKDHILEVMSTQNEFGPLIETVNLGIESFQTYGKSLFETSKYYERLNTAQEKFEQSLESMSQSAKFAQTRIDASFKSISTSLGAAMAPALQTAADLMETLSRNIEDVVLNNKGLFALAGNFMLIGGAVLSLVGTLLVLSGTIALLSVGYRELQFLAKETAIGPAIQNNFVTPIKNILKLNQWSTFFAALKKGFNALGQIIMRAVVNPLKAVGKRVVATVARATAPARSAISAAASPLISSAAEGIRGAGMAARARAIQIGGMPGRAMDYLQRRITTARAKQPSIVQRGIDFVEQRPKVQKFYGAISAQGTMTPSQAIPRAAIAQATKAWEAFVLKGGNAMIASLEAGEKFITKTIPGIRPMLNRAWESYIRVGGDVMVAGLEGGERLLISFGDRVDASARMARQTIGKIGPTLNKFILNFYDATVGNLQKFNFGAMLESIKTGLQNGLGRVTASVNYFKSGGARRTISTAFDSMKVGIKNFAAAARQQVRFVAEAIKPIAQRAVSIAKSGGAAVTAAGKGAVAAGGAGVGILKGAATALFNSKGVKALMSMVSKLFGFLKTGALKAGSALKGIFSPIAVIIEFMIGFVSGFFKVFSTESKKAGEEAKKGFNPFAMMIEWILSLFNLIVAVFDIIRAVGEALGALTARLIQGLGDLPVIGTIVDIASAGVGAVTGFVNGLADAIGGAADNLSSFANEVANGVNDMRIELSNNERTIADLEKQKIGASAAEKKRLDEEIAKLRLRNSLLRTEITTRTELGKAPTGTFDMAAGWLAAQKAKAAGGGTTLDGVEEDTRTALEKALDIARQGADLKKALAEIGNTNLLALVNKSMGKVATAVKRAIELVAEATKGLSTQAQQDAADFSENAQKVVGAVADAVEAFKGLSSVKVPNTAKIVSVITALKTVVSTFVSKMTGFDATKLANSAAISGAASDIAQAVGSAVSAFNDLSQKVGNFQPLSYIQTLIANINMVVKAFVAGTTKIGTLKVLEASAKIADAADAIVSAVGSAAGMFKDLSQEITMPSATLIGRVIDSMASIVQTFVARSGQFGSLVSAEAAAKFAEPAQAIMDAIGSTVNTFKDINTFVAPLESVVDDIISTMQMAITKMVSLSDRLAYDIKKLESTKTFSDVVTAVAEAVGNTYEAFYRTITGLDEFNQVIDVDQVFGWIEQSLTRMSAIAGMYSAAEIEKIASAADAASRVAEAINTFFGIAATASDDPTRLSNALQESIQTIIDGIVLFNQGVASTGANFVDQLIAGMQSKEGALQAQTDRLTSILGTAGNSSATGTGQKLEITHVISDPTGALKNATASEVAAILSGDQFITNLRQSIKTQ